MTSLNITKEQLDLVFPFHFLLDRKLRTVQIGKTLKRLLPEHRSFAPFENNFKVQSPKVTLSFDSFLEQTDTVFFINVADTNDLTLRGQWLPLTHTNSDDLLLFICSPVVRDMSGVISLGLGLNDFAIHDSVLDLMLVMQGKNNTINDTMHMADQLKKEVVVRREAEKSLQAINANQQLLIEEATEELATANNELQSTVSTLIEQNRIMDLLNKMSDKLQSCSELDQAYEIISLYLQKMFPGSLGMVAFKGDLVESLHRKIRWGGDLCCKPELTDSSCHAIRDLNKKSIELIASDAIVCPDAKYLSLCQPLHMRDSLVGVIHIGWDFHPENALLSDDHKRFLKVAGEHIVLATHNITLQRKLLQQSTRDALTGLYNRRFMEDSISRETKRADRNHTEIGVIMLDVDFFKKFNDTWGHEAGDLVLVKLARFLEQHVRGEDLACRYGGEEFILLLPGADIENTRKRAQQICNDAEAGLFLDHEGNHIGPVTLSLGVSSYPKFSSSFRAVLKAADDALYQAKRNGRNRVEVAQVNSDLYNPFES